MKMNELREAFRTWSRDNFDASIIVEELTDPTPITEAGLRELGFEGSVETEFYAGELRGWFDDGRFFFYNCMQYPKSMGQLRGLLLFVGE